MDSFGRIDANIPHPMLPASNSDIDGVPIHHIYHLSLNTVWSHEDRRGKGTSFFKVRYTYRNIPSTINYIMKLEGGKWYLSFNTEIAAIMSNENMAISALKMLVGCEEDFRTHDRDGDTKQNYE